MRWLTEGFLSSQVTGKRRCRKLVLAVFFGVPMS